MPTEKDRVAVIVDDMFFAVKIKGAAEACGRQIERIKSREQLEDLRSAPPSLVIIDLNCDRLDPIETIRYLKTQTGLDVVPIVSFVSHVETEQIRSAQAAGCDYVFPRSAFTQMLVELVAGNLPKPGQRS
jgi:DNA-binding NarL/FixJ family response regulator